MPRSVPGPIAIPIDVAHSHGITPPKSFTVVVPVGWCDEVRIAELIAVIYVGWPMVLVVSPCALDTVLEAAPHRLLEGRGGNVPATLAVARSWQWWPVVLGNGNGGTRGYRERKNGCNPACHSHRFTFQLLRVLGVPAPSCCLLKPRLCPQVADPFPDTTAANPRDSEAQERAVRRTPPACANRCSASSRPSPSLPIRMAVLTLLPLACSNSAAVA